MIKRISTFILLTTLFSFALWFEIPSPNWFVNDLTSTLTVDQKTQISDLISNIKQTTSTEIAVLIVPTIDWDDANLLAAEIWTQRWVWEKWKDNWIIMLFAMEDRSRSIQVWYWLEWTIPDAIAKRIWENNIVPNFKQWNYFQGIYAALNEIYLYIQQDPTVVEAYSASTNNNTTSNREDFGFFRIVFLFAISWSIGRAIVPKTKRKNKSKRAIAIAVIAWIWIIVWIIAWSIILSVIIWYLWMLLWIFGKWGNGWAWWWIIGGWGFGGWWWSSFWWFWWWGFGGGGGWWKR